MSEPQNSAKLDEIEQALGPFFECNGFSHKKRNFSRETEPGLVQIVNFQMGRSGSTLEGSFAINLAVFIDEVHAILNPGRHPLKKISEPDCEFRVRLLTLESNGTDRWLDTGDSAPTLVTELERVLSTTGLPVLQRYSTRRLILEEWKRTNIEDVWGIGRVPAAISILLARGGEPNQALEILQGWLKTANPVARPFVLGIIRKLGLQLTPS